MIVDIFMLFFTILFVAFVAASEIDICVPSFPLLKHTFDLSTSETEMILSINLLSHCIGALICGNLGDKYGKKRIIQYGLTLFTLSSILCMLSTTYMQLLIGRILQGFSVAAPMVLAPLIIMDRYPQEKHQKMMNMFNGFCTIGICVAPIIGSYSTLYFGWQGSFAILSILGIISILMFSIFIANDKPKTNEIEIHIREYLVIFQSPITRLYLFALSLSIAAYYTFVGMAPIIYIESFGVPLEKFGLYQGSLTLTFGIFSVLADPISKLIGKKNAFNISIILILISLCTSLSIIILNISDPLIITYSILIISVGVVIPVNVMYVSALASIEGAGGRISAMITIGKWVMTMAGIQIASFFYTNDFKSSGITMITMDTLSIIIGFVLFKKDKSFRNAIT